jgi:hypothetical protein
MLRKGPAAAFPLIFLAPIFLVACGLGERGEASAAVARFLAAVQSGDRAGFEAGIDRVALRSDLAGQMADVGKARGLDIGEPPSEFALDRMINQQAVARTAAQTAPGWPAAPTAAQVTPRLKVRDRTHVCLEQESSKRCLLDFAKKDGAWRLVGMPAAAAQPTT